MNRHDAAKLLLAFGCLAVGMVGCQIWRASAQLNDLDKAVRDRMPRKKKMQYYETNVTGQSGVVTLVHTDRHFDEKTQTWEDAATWAARHAEAIEAAKQF